MDIFKVVVVIDIFKVIVVIDIFKVIVVIDIGYGYLNSVVCLNDENIWICGNDKMIRFYNL